MWVNFFPAYVSLIPTTLTKGPVNPAGYLFGPTQENEAQKQEKRAGSRNGRTQGDISR